MNKNFGELGFYFLVSLIIGIEESFFFFFCCFYSFWLVTENFREGNSFSSRLKLVDLIKDGTWFALEKKNFISFDFFQSCVILKFECNGDYKDI